MSFNNSNATHVNIVHVCVYSFICTAGLAFNLAALAFFCTQTKSRSQTIVYMTNLAIADTLLILTLPMRIYYHLGFHSLPPWLCDVLGLVLKANMYGSIFLLTCICFDRCMAVCFPMSLRVQRGRRRAPWICLGIWVLTFGASLPIYLSRRQQFSSKECFESAPKYAIQLVVILPTLLLGFAFPLLTMLVCSCALVRAVRHSTAAQTKLVDSRKIYRMIATSVLIFLISFLPYHAALVVLYLHKEPTRAALDAYGRSLMLACFNTVLDPVAYYFTTDTFRSKVDLSAVQRMFPLNSQSSEVNSRHRGPTNS